MHEGEPPTGDLHPHTHAPAGRTPGRARDRRPVAVWNERERSRLGGGPRRVALGGSEISIMRCKFGHDHRSETVKAATDNPMEPWGPRPFHCPECFQTRRRDTVASYWHSYRNVSEAQAQGHERPCKSCFSRSP